MSNFEHWIREDSTEFEKAFLKIYDGSLWTAIEKMKDWQPPKELIEVPQCVDDAIKALPDYYSAYGAIELIRSKITEFEEENEDWLDVYNWMFKENNANKFAMALIDGYTVEKEQMFILKHIDMSKLSADDSLYLAHGVYEKLQHVRYSKDVDMSKVDDCHFTQSEIDELNIGSYEQIEVKVDEVEG